jgi:ribosomal protein S18 acetylase RimI-like enzyme
MAASDLLLATADETADDGCMCGFAWALPTRAFGRSPYLRLIGVHSDRARSWVGARLLDAVEQRCGADDLFLLVSDFNTKAQAFYRHHGYMQVGVIPGCVLSDVTELIFRKRLRR